MQWRKNNHLFELSKKNDGLFNVCFSQRPLSIRKVKKKSLRTWRMLSVKKLSRKVSFQFS